MREFLTLAFKKLDIKAMDLVEISPKLDCNDITSWLGLKLIYEGIEYIIDEIIISSYVNLHECWCKDKEGNKLRIGIEYDYENVRFKILDYTLYK